MQPLEVTAIFQKLLRKLSYHGEQSTSGRKPMKTSSEAWEDALYEALDKIEVTVVADAYDVMGTAMKSGDSSMTAALLNHFRWILSRRRPEKWGDREKVELSGPQGGPIQTEQTVHLPDDDTLAEILRIRESQGKGKVEGEE